MFCSTIFAGVAGVGRTVKYCYQLHFAKMKLTCSPKRGIKTFCYSCYHLERGGDITHLQMRFNLVNNVTWPLFLAPPSVFMCSLGLQKLFGEILNSIRLCSVCILIFFALKNLVTFTNSLWIERNFPLVKTECCVVL